MRSRWLLMSLVLMLGCATREAPPSTSSARSAARSTTISTADYVRDLTQLRDTLTAIIGQYETTPPPPVPTVSLSAAPTTITGGQSSALTWSSTDATGCTASGAWSGSKAASGSEAVTPTATSTYSLVCTGAGGSSPAVSATVTVTTAPPPGPTSSISATPASIQAGQSSTLSWSSTNATGCTASGAWTGAKGTTGTEAVSPTATSIYTVACTGAAGTSPAASTTVAVTTAPPPGGAVTSFQLAGTGVVYERGRARAATAAPFSVGVGIAKGDAPNTLVTDLATAQVVVKARWNDGSVKHAIVSGQAILPATVTLNRSTAAPPAGLTAADIQAANPAASVALSGYGTVDLSPLLATPFRTWISGPEMVEAHYRAQVGSDPTLVVWFHVRLWKGGRLWIRSVVENGYIDVTTNTRTYTATITVGGAGIFNSSVTHYANTRWSAEGWIGGVAQVTPRHDTVYLMERAKLVPNYWKRNPTDAAFSALVQSYVPMQRGNLEQDMSATGFQDQIGLLPKWDALYVTSADPRAYRASLANSSALNTYPVVWRDSKTNLPARPVDYPTYGIGGGGAYSWAAGSNNWNYSHSPSEGYLSYLITGDYWHYETMLLQTAMNYLALGSGSGSGVNRLMLGDTRGHGWAMRTLVQLVGIAPAGDTVADNYRVLLTNNVNHWKKIRDGLGNSGIGYLYEYSFPYGTGILAPWQDHFVIQAYGHGSDLEPLPDMTNFLAVRDWWYRGAVGILGDASGFCFADASTYTAKASNTSNTDPRTFYQTWAEVYNATYPNKPCGNTLLGTSGGNPASANLGYWGNLLPAISYAVDHGAPGAATALARIQGATNYSVFESADWAGTPNWGIIPRGTVTPPPTSPTATLSAAPASIQTGQASTLSWSSTNATGCTASGGWSGSKATSGTQSVSPTTSTTYNLACTGTDAKRKVRATSPTVSATVTVTTTPPPTSSSLGALAASLQPGQWGELQTNLSYSMVVVSAGHIFTWADSMVWDPTTKQGLFVGGAHDPVPNTRHIIYSDASGAWREATPQPWFPQTSGSVMHAYDHNAVDPTRGVQFHRPFGSKATYAYNAAANTWSRIADFPSGYGTVCCSGLAFFPERDGLVYAGGGEVMEWSRPSNTWTVRGNHTMGSHLNFAEYNPVHKLVLFGGGNGSKAIYVMDAKGAITRKADAPINLVTSEASVTVDPVSGDYLIFAKSGDRYVFHVYKPMTDTWSTRPMGGITGTIDINSAIIPTPVSTYGVVFMATYHMSATKVYVYKHQP